MGIADLLILAVLFVWLRAALCFMKRKKPDGCSGCTGDCERCGK